MFELPELTVIAAQMNDEFPGKTITGGRLGNTPHKFVWYDRSHDEFAAMTPGCVAGGAWVEGKWLFLPLEPGYVLLLGEWGGRIRRHAAGESLPGKYHLWLVFDDGASFTATTQMWGGVHTCEAGHEHEVKYVDGMRTTPVETGFDRAYFGSLPPRRRWAASAA